MVEGFAAEGGGRRRAGKYIAIAVAIVVVLLVAVLFTRKSADDRADYDPLEGKPAPAIVGTTLDGKPFDVDALRGKWVVVNFFATWCVPCQDEHADLLSFDRRHAQANDPVQLVSVVFNDDLNAVRDFYAKNGGDWPVVTGDQGRMALDYSVVKVPDTYIIDPLGVVRARIPREVANTDELDQVIGALSQQLYPAQSSGPG